LVIIGLFGLIASPVAVRWRGILKQNLMENKHFEHSAPIADFICLMAQIQLDVTTAKEQILNKIFEQILGRLVVPEDWARVTLVYKCGEPDVTFVYFDMAFIGTLYLEYNRADVAVSFRPAEPVDPNIFQNGMLHPV